MRRMRFPIPAPGRTPVRWLAALAVAAGAVVSPARAQLAPDDAPVKLSEEPFVNVVDVRQASHFNLEGLGDFARTGVFTTGTTRWCYGNTGWFEPYFDLGCNYFGLRGTAISDPVQVFFEVPMVAGAPPSDMPPSVQEALESGILKGGGWTIPHNNYILTGDQVWRGSDRSGRELLAFGITSTEDGSCRDFSAFMSGSMDPGFQLLPSNVCKPTWPPGGWLGSKKTTKESFILANDAGAMGDDPFAFWRVPEEFRQDNFMGNFHTFGEMSDYSLDLLPEYGGVTPHGSGEPIRQGWPLGIDLFFDGFYFNLPTVNNAFFYEVKIVNNSAKVYGEGVDYDSLYFGMMADWLMDTQGSAVYTVPEKGAVVSANPGSGACGVGTPPYPPGSSCGGRYGFRLGAGAIVFLKTPLGDLRNKLLSNPGSEFYNPSHPAADDTITFNHQHMCGFGSCWATNIARSPRSAFGMWSSTEENVLDGRSAGGLTERDLWRTFRSENWPGAPTDVARFNRFAPGGWDYNEDGVQDTIFADNCGRNGCVPRWSDTLPSGHVNSYANISVVGFGPFSIAAGDTLGWTMAFIAAPDSASFEGLLDNVIAFYQEFYFGPEAPDPVRVVTSDVTVGNVDDNSVSIFIDDTADDFVDPFLESFAGKVEEAAPTSALGKLRQLNPWLVDSLRIRAASNIEALHIFKSCDGGTTWTDDGNCFGDPVPSEDPNAKFGSFGWLPYITLEPDAQGKFPNVITDAAVTPGITYTYTLVVESKGASFQVLRDNGSGDLPRDENGNALCDPSRCGPGVETFAPKLFNPLSRSTADPNVLAVYVPVSRAAGERDAEVEIARSAGYATAPFDVLISGRKVTGGSYKAVFGDRILVSRSGGTTTVTVQDTETVLRPGATVAETAVLSEQSFSGSREVTISGTGSEVDATTTSYGFGMVVLDGQGQPIIVSTTLSANSATPGSFLSRPDFPFFVVEANNSVAGQFDSQIYTRADGRAISTRVQPTVRWLERNADALAGRYGEYVVSWADEAFGPQSPFDINRADLEAAVGASLNARAVASTSRADQGAIDALAAAGISVESLSAVKLPFQIQNSTYGNPVDVVVLSHQASTVLGKGGDTARVAVPSDAWIPGDRLVLLETIQVDSTVQAEDANGNEVTAVVVDGSGQPVRVSRTVATWDAVIGCADPRPSCNPTLATDPRTGGSGYVVTDPDFILTVHYYNPFRAGTVYDFAITPPVLASQLSPSEWDLSKVRVVPNPYRFYNEWESSSASQIRFTNLPPEGTIRIYTVAGQFVQELRWGADDLIGGDGSSGDLPWNMQTRERTEMSYGLYIWVLQTPDGRKQAGKFVVLR